VTADTPPPVNLGSRNVPAGGNPAAHWAITFGAGSAGRLVACGKVRRPFTWPDDRPCNAFSREDCQESQFRQGQYYGSGSGVVVGDTGVIVHAPESPGALVSEKYSG